MLKAAQVHGCVPFNCSAFGNSADRRMIDGSWIASRAFRVAANDQRPLRLGINLSIGRAKSGQQQHAALDALGIAHR